LHTKHLRTARPSGRRTTDSEAIKKFISCSSHQCYQAPSGPIGRRNMIFVRFRESEISSKWRDAHFAIDRTTAHESPSRNLPNASMLFRAEWLTYISPVRCSNYSRSNRLIHDPSVARASFDNLRRNCRALREFVFERPASQSVSATGAQSILPSGRPGRCGLGGPLELSRWHIEFQPFLCRSLLPHMALSYNPNPPLGGNGPVQYQRIASPGILVARPRTRGCSQVFAAALNDRNTRA
jgi:hypothetical protein